MPTARQTAKMRGTSTASGVLLLDLGASSPPSSVGRNEYDPERQRTDIVEVYLFFGALRARGGAQGFAAIKVMRRLVE